MFPNLVDFAVGDQKILDSPEYFSVLAHENERKSSDATYDTSCLLPNPTRDEDEHCFEKKPCLKTYSIIYPHDDSLLFF